MLNQVVGFFLLIATPLLATNTAGDPTDLTNWPPCAEKCIPTGFGPPADCSSLSNLTCICQKGTFSAQISTCEKLGCSSQELTDISTLSQRLCAPVGGFGTSLLATLSILAGSTQSSISATPTIPPTVTAGGPVSSVLATATLAPNLGNPANLLNYPLCAQVCNNETVVIIDRTNLEIGDLSNLDVLCGASFRGLTAGCEAATCSDADYTKTQLLAQQLCGSLYASNTTLSSSASAAIASATAAAKAATEGKDPTNISSLPACAQACLIKNNYYGCGSLSNLECVCQGIAFNNASEPCETSTCSATNFTALDFIAEKLCEPVGGTLTHPVNYTATSNTGNNTAGSSSPSPSPFTGVGSHFGKGIEVFAFSALGIAVGLLML